MRLGVLFSGGKDSVLALDRAREYHEIAGLITIRSSNPDSYMFHTVGIEHTEAQAKAMELPHMIQETRGNKEEELEDLEEAILRAKQEWGIEGVVSGAIASTYQASRVQRACHRLGVVCFNPLWLEAQRTVLEEVLGKGYNVMISGVFAYPLGEEYLGRILDQETVSSLLKLEKEMGFNPAGEGGEIETFVLGGPVFKKSLKVNITGREYRNYSGRVQMEVEV
ncbi:MAG: diphthine--ammonia ligase [Candidatus Thermoplasmatota archaeon]|nr:diphthine--ammonia ligase [Candidatus Thermoplasmatota archaeon]